MTLISKFLGFVVIAELAANCLAIATPQKVGRENLVGVQDIVPRVDGVVCDLYMPHAANAWFYSNALHFLDDFITREGPGK
jgi:hypothetical protein